MLVRYTQELLRNHKISDAAFNAVQDRFGVQGTVDITALIGHYLLVGQILTAFEVDLAPGSPRSCKCRGGPIMSAADGLVYALERNWDMWTPPCPNWMRTP